VSARLVSAVCVGCACCAVCEASTAAVIVRCTNPYSRASWTIAVDYAHRTVDQFPAKISSSEIRWDDTVHGGHYSLNRMTGELTVIFASSTGGYMLHDVCDLRSTAR
jgi:hypothetical protein